MSKGPLVTCIVSLVAIGVVIAAFASNASPYVTARQALTMRGEDHLHIAGDIVKESVHMDLHRHTLVFDLKDSEGTLLHVVHVGDPPANLREANKVVAIGGMKGDVFESQQLLVKCPSKYEAETPVARN